MKHLCGFIFKAHWRSKRRYVMLGLLLGLISVTFFIFKQQQNVEQSQQIMAIRYNTSSMKLLYENEKAIKRSGLKPFMQAQNRAKQGDERAFVQLDAISANLGSNEAYGVNNGAVLSNSGEQLHMDDRFGPIVVQRAMANRKKLDAQLLKQNLPLSSIRYGTGNWTFVISLLPLLTSLAGLVLLVSMIFIETFYDLTSHRCYFLTALPLTRRQVFLSQTIVFFIDVCLLLFICLGFAWGLSTGLGQRLPGTYPILAQFHHEFTIIPATLVTLSSAFLFLMGCLVIYLFVRLVLISLHALTDSILRLGTLLLSYSLVFLITLLSYLPGLCPRFILQWLPSSYLQASRVLFGTDYIAQFFISITEFNTLPDHPRTMITALIQNLNYYNGSTIGNVGNYDLQYFGGFLQASAVLGGTIAILLILNCTWLTRTNRIN
ncbi:hypothetical protein ACFQ5M_07285 [Agrilactobacillus yilanensis]|uniref:ABC transporter permease n=1 Tax=Agrilactobacillus yilanensis TaxID=2485997 RepID=A0ABW4J6M2_9LACO|nr:hypothetical protein [Agrilactobacillus yilanensis]